MGVLLIQCMTKEQLKDLAGVERALESIPVPPDVRRLLGACIATQPDDRPKNASDLLGALKAIQQRRQAQQQVARNPIWLRLTKSAIRSLGGNEEARQEAIGKAQADLSGDVYASFFNDQQSGELQRDSIRLDGEAWSLTLKSDESGAVIVKAAELDFERLENHRRRALLLPKVFDWMFNQPANPALARTGIATLIDTIDAFYEAKDQVRRTRRRGARRRRTLRHLAASAQRTRRARPRREEAPSLQEVAGTRPRGHLHPWSPLSTTISWARSGESEIR